MSSTRPVDTRKRGSFEPGRGILPGLHLIQSARTREACHAAMAQNAELLEDLFGFSILLMAEAVESGRGPAIIWRNKPESSFADLDLAAWLRRAQIQAGRAVSCGAAAAGVAMGGGFERDA